MWNEKEFDKDLKAAEKHVSLMHGQNKEEHGIKALYYQNKCKRNLGEKGYKGKTNKELFRMSESFFKKHK
jgi:hypothetical protein